MRNVGRKLPPQALLLGTLFLNRQLLVPDAVHQRCKLGVRAGIQRIKIQFINGLYDLPCGSKREQRRNHQHKQQHKKDRTDRHQGIAHRAHGPGQPQYRPVAAQQRIVHGFLSAAFRLPDSLSLSCFQCFRHFGTVQLVGDRKAKIAVVQDAAVVCDPGNAVDLSERLEITLPADCQPVLGIDRFLLQGQIGFIQRLSDLQGKEQRGTEKQHQNAQNKGRAKDLLCHPSSPPSR